MQKAVKTNPVFLGVDTFSKIETNYQTIQKNKLRKFGAFGELSYKK